jgi:hypothetical protein
MGGLVFRVCTVANRLVIAKTFFNWEGKLEKGGLKQQSCPLVWKPGASDRNRLPQELRIFDGVHGLPAHTVCKSPTQAESLFNLTLAAFFRNISQCFS